MANNGYVLQSSTSTTERSVSSFPMKHPHIPHFAVTFSALSAKPRVPAIRIDRPKNSLSFLDRFMLTFPARRIPHSSPPTMTLESAQYAKPRDYMENGRLYHGYRKGKYMFPCDEVIIHVDICMSAAQMETG